MGAVASEQFADGASLQGTLSRQEIHARLMRLARRKASYDVEEGEWLVRGLRARVHEELGFGSYLEYLERMFGYGAKVASERLRVAEALQELPRMRSVLADGAMNWSVARELTRVATADTEQAWLEAAEDKTVREVERMVSGRQLGDRPEDPADDRARRHVVRFEVNAETLALLREAQSALVRQTGHHLDDDELVQLLAREVLGGPGDEGRSSYQIAVSICQRCGEARQQAGGDEVPVDPVVAEMACCDGQHIGSVAHVGPGDSREPEERERPPRTPHGTSAHVGNSRSRRPPQFPQPRAAQTIPPAIRRAVMRRHGGRCAVPGCRHRTFMDVHHLDRRADGGSHDPDRLIVLCGAHHSAEHRGRLVIEGRASTGFRFHHADGSRYGGLARPSADPIGAKAYADAHSALRNAGFRETQVRQALADIRAHVGIGASAEAIVQAALRHLMQAARAQDGPGLVWPGPAGPRLGAKMGRRSRPTAPGPARGVSCGDPQPPLEHVSPSLHPNHSQPCGLRTMMFWCMRLRPVLRIDPAPSARIVQSSRPGRACRPPQTTIRS